MTTRPTTIIRSHWRGLKRKLPLRSGRRHVCWLKLPVVDSSRPSRTASALNVPLATNWPIRPASSRRRFQGLLPLKQHCSRCLNRIQRGDRDKGHHNPEDPVTQRTGVGSMAHGKDRVRHVEDEIRSPADRSRCWRIGGGRRAPDHAILGHRLLKCCATSGFQSAPSDPNRDGDGHEIGRTAGSEDW